MVMETNGEKFEIKTEIDGNTERGLESCYGGSRRHFTHVSEDQCLITYAQKMYSSFLALISPVFKLTVLARSTHSIKVRLAAVFQ